MSAGGRPILGGAGPFRQRLFAWGFARFSKHAEQYMQPYKTRFLRDLSGAVLEIGPGTGANLRYLKGQPVTWIGVEPNRFMRRYLMREAAALGMPADVRPGTAEALPAASGAIDAVISSLVLCSVTDPARVLGEVRRVLKPGGRFIFFEHVAAPQGTTLRRLQGWLRPLWRRMGDGCHPDRELGRAIQEAGFASVTMESFAAPVPVVRPHIAGIAIK